MSPLDQNEIGFACFENFIDAAQEMDRQVSQGLIRPHDPQVMIRLDLEYLEHLLKQFVVLARCQDDGLEAAGSAAQVP